MSNGGRLSGPPAKRAYREGIGVGGLRIGRRGRPPLSPSSLPLTRSRRQPPPSQRLLLQHQQNRRRAGALELQLRKRVSVHMVYRYNVKLLSIRCISIHRTTCLTTVIVRSWRCTNIQKFGSVRSLIFKSHQDCICYQKTVIL